VADLAQDAHWIEVKFVCNGELAEALAEVLGRFVSNGVVIENVTRFNPDTQENESTGLLQVFGYLALDEDLQQKQTDLEKALWHLSQIMTIPQPEYRPIVDQDWMTAWKQHYHPIPIGENLLIMPVWKKEPILQGRTIIRIDPAMAFGTGTHPTTQLCLQLLERYLNHGDDVIDVGCGSGILSIAALKLGAQHALAVDIDSQAVTATLENAQINELQSECLETGKGSIEEILAGCFSIQRAPLVLVNILAPVITHLFDQGLAGLVTQGGILLLSGILIDQTEDVLKKAQSKGFTLREKLTQDDWISLAVEKPFKN
jgi:ribosomal protein L11 methyltransferase